MLVILPPFKTAKVLQQPPTKSQQFHFNFKPPFPSEVIDASARLFETLLCVQRDQIGRNFATWATLGYFFLRNFAT
jgi:hypothetical protein